MKSREKGIPERRPSDMIVASLTEKMGSSASRFRIDGQTASDLGLDDYSARFNLSFTTPGDAYFHYSLHSQPRGDGDRSLIAEFKPPEGTDAEYALSRLGRQRRGDAIADLWDGIPEPFALSGWVKPWFYGSICLTAVAGLAFGGGGLLLAAMAIVMANTFIFSRTNPAVGTYSGSLKYLASIVRFWESRHLDGYAGTAEARRLCAPLSRLGRKVGFFMDGVQGNDPVSSLLDYARIFLLAELRAFLDTRGIVNANLEAFRRLVVMTGELDAGLAALRAMEREGGPVRARIGRGRFVEARDLVHPLVEGCVPNDVSLTGGVVVTGLNMSGKSTYLRSLALNQILATGLGYAHASSYRASPLLVMTSLQVSDSVRSGISRYFAEAERLLEIMNAARESPVLCVVDEILSGTNHEDRVAASVAVLDALAGYGSSLVVAATHDLDIPRSVSGGYGFLHFDAAPGGGAMSFDYRAKPGIAGRRNALLILEHLGFRRLASIPVPNRDPEGFTTRTVS